MIFKKFSRPGVVAVAGSLAMLQASVANAAYELNMTEGVTPISKELYGLHMLVFWICVAIGILVFGAMAWSILYHRKSKGAQAANFHESTTVEIIWTIVPLLILIGIAIPATGTLLDLEDAKTDAEITVQVTGIQWKWKYTYVDEDISFVSNLAQTSRDVFKDPTGNENYLLEVDEPLVLPVNKKVRFLFHSDDVIHAWWVPELAVKQDAIPGFINDSWATIEQPGTYRGQCSELCGKDHGFMPIVVEAVTESEYREWLAGKKAAAVAAASAAEQEWSMQDLMARGETVYQANCSACHGVTGAGIPGAFPAMTGSAIILDPDPSAHIDIVVNGKAGTAMASFKGQLNDVDIASVLTYERNALGNSVGTVIQPSVIKNAR
ncbi:MAG: cytochrome c oxidase subunit II [Gammaproteobacteria bacterium]|nr:cytochrome c oxidase subunit II [Gammaproteobacteria bacterium]MDH3449291.1 cytochrome c oxidase subunit II [Gammaproteobacteria bacterium]